MLDKTNLWQCLNKATECCNYTCSLPHVLHRHESFMLMCCGVSGGAAPPPTPPLPPAPSASLCEATTATNATVALVLSQQKQKRTGGISWGEKAVCVTINWSLSTLGPLSVEVEAAQTHTYTVESRCFFLSACMTIKIMLNKGKTLIAVVLQLSGKFDRLDIGLIVFE